MEFNNSSSREQNPSSLIGGNRPAPHQIIFFNNPDSSAYKKNQSADYFDEQELPQTHIDMEDELEDQRRTFNNYTGVREKNAAKSFLQPKFQPQQQQEVKVTGLRHPFSSSAMFNAFNEERAHKSMGGKNLPTAFSPPGMGGRIDPRMSNFEGQAQRNMQFYPGQEREEEECQMTDQDFDGHGDMYPEDNDCEEDFYSQQDQDHEFQDDTLVHQQQQQESLSQEGNIPGSSVSASPDEKQQYQPVITLSKVYGEYLTNEMDDREEDLRESNMFRSSDPNTDKSSIGDFQKSKNGMIVERNDRFIIFKMVPQGNIIGKARDQPTPVLGERHNLDQNQHQNTKLYSETVEDVESSQSNHDADDDQDDDDGNDNDDGYGQEEQEQSEEDQEYQNDIEMHDAQLRMSQIQSNIRSPAQIKSDNSMSPMNNNIDESLFEETHVVQHEIRTMRNQLIQNNSQHPSGKKSLDKTPINRNLGGKQLTLAQLRNNEQESKMIQDNDISSFSLQKSLTVISRSSSDKFSQLQKLEKKTVNEDQLEFTQTQDNLNLGKQNSQFKTQANRQEAEKKIIKDKKTDPAEQEKLMMEYMMLKKMMKKMNNEPHKVIAKNQNQEAKIKSQQSQSKSRVNIQNQQKSMNYHSNKQTLGIQEDQKKQVNKSGNLSQQQSTKNNDKKEKNFFRNDKSQLQLKTEAKRDASKNKLSQRQSPRDERKQQKSSHRPAKQNYNKRIDNDSETEYEKRDLSSQSSPDKSQRRHVAQKQGRHTEVVGRRVNDDLSRRHQKSQRHRDSLDKSENSENEQSQEEDEDSQYYSESQGEDDDSRYEDHSHMHSRHKVRHHHSHNRKHRNQSHSQNRVSDNEGSSDHYYSEDDQSSSQGESQDSQECSESEQSYDDSYDQQSDDHNRRNRHRSRGTRKQTSASRQRKGKKVVKTYTQGDRKFKINLHMHGDKHSRQRQEKQPSQDDIIQRQMLQQQQLIIQMASQYPQQQMLLQQQLALQQQMMMQPAAPFFSPNNIQSAINLGVQTPILNQMNLNNVSSTAPSHNTNSVDETASTRQNLRRNASGLNLTSQQSQSTNQREYITQNLSPKRDIPFPSSNNNPSSYQANVSQMRSPREQSKHNPIFSEPSSQNQVYNPQTNYLNQLKNRFKTGAEANNREESYQRQMPMFEENARNYEGNQMSSRNNQMIQNNSSPQKRENDYGFAQGGYSHHRPDSIDYSAQQKRLEEQKDSRALFNKHTRTNSHMNQPEQLYSRVNNINEQDDYEKIRQRYNQHKSPRMEDDQFFKQPQLHQKKTGDFSRDIRTEVASPMMKSDNLFDRQAQRSLSPSNDLDQSMDEGVKASTTRETMQKSPKTSNADLSKINSTKKSLFSPNQDPRQSVGISKTQTKNTFVEKKGPQAIIIGFDDVQTLRDPFQKKPQLKPREKQSANNAIDLAQRSKSTKGFVGAKNTINQRKSPDERRVNQKNESPLKKAVKEIKQKENKQELCVSNDAEEQRDVIPNKGIMIEIFDNKKQTDKEISLAEMFKAKAKEGAGKKPWQQQAQDQDIRGGEHQMKMDQDNQPGIKKQEKTKEELAELRKKMMKSKVKRNNDVKDDKEPLDISDMKKPSKKDPKEDLMLRLAMGQKVQVDKKEMKKLTSKNFQNLPEIKKKKEDELKRQEIAARKAAAADYMKQLNDKRRQLLKKKKSIIDEE